MSANPEAFSAPEATSIAVPRRPESDGAWRQFAAATSPEEFCRSWLEVQCQLVGAVSHAVVVLQKPGLDTFAPIAVWPEGRRERSGLAELVERALREGRGIVEPRAAGAAPGPRPDYQLAYP